MATPELFPRILAAEIDGRMHSIRYRQTQFHRLQSALVQHIEEIRGAILEESGHSLEEVSAEICLALDEIRSHYTSLDLDKDLQEEYSIAHGKNRRGGRRGAGIVYIIPIDHTLFYSVISVLAAALAAGNCIILELARPTQVSALLRKVLVDAFDQDIFAISEQRPDDEFLSRTVVINQQASFSASSVDPRAIAVVDRTANISQAADALASARFRFGGRSPYAPDIVLVHEFILKDFVESVTRASWSHCAVENKRSIAAHSLDESLLKETEHVSEARIVVSSSNWGIVEVQDRNSPLLLKKVNEKVLLVHPITSLDDAIDTVQRNSSPAASYIFASPESAKYLAQFIDAHLSWVNHVPMDIFIGPAIPYNSALGESTRYPVDIFEVPRSQIVTEGTASFRIKTFLGATGPQTAVKMWQTSIAPLKPTGQRPGKAVGHFEQGLISGGIVALISVLAVTSTVGYYAVAYGSKLASRI
ncbi:aldehyde dehydrogenase PutA [Penicillium sp. IBT 35674x]|nr:aldehyde dehydrogenase PutA [Penicillium sp. IBT 35674x]